MSKCPTLVAFISLFVGLVLASWLFTTAVVLFMIPLAPGIAFLGMSDDERGGKKWLYLLLGLILSLIGSFVALFCFAQAIEFYQKHHP